LVVDRFAEQDDIGDLTVDGDDGRIRRGDDDQIGPSHPLAHELAKGLCLRGVGFDGQQPANVSLHVQRHPGVLRLWASGTACVVSRLSSSYSFAIDVPRMWFAGGRDKYIVTLGLRRMAPDRGCRSWRCGLTILLGR